MEKKRKENFVNVPRSLITHHIKNHIRNAKQFGRKADKGYKLLSERDLVDVALLPGTLSYLPSTSKCYFKNHNN